MAVNITKPYLYEDCTLPGRIRKQIAIHIEIMQRTIREYYMKLWKKIENL